MADTTSGTQLSITRLILIPSVITLAITILRLVGELQHWSPIFFGTAAGGGLAIVGISWLPFIFGPYFALKLSGAGEGPASRAKPIGFAVLGVLLAIAGAFVSFGPKFAFPGKVAVGMLLMALGGALQFLPWSSLAKTLLAYGYAARIPVAIVMFFAFKGNWGTHYDALPPGYSGPMTFWGKYVALALLPQMIFWIVFTMAIGALIGSIVTAIAGRGKTVAQPAA